MNNTKTKILTAALHLFNQHGLVNVRLQQIANEVGISVGNLAYHYYSKEAIVKAIDQKVVAGLNFYQNKLTDLFVQQSLLFDGSPSTQFQNIGEATITGLEWSVKAKLGTLSQVFFSGSYVKGENDVTGNPLSEIPALQNILGIHFRDRNNRFFVQADAIMVGEQTDIAPNEQETPSHTVININAGINLHELINNFPYTKFMIGATNLTDKAYRSHVSRGAPGNQNVFLEAGRSINIGFVTRFGAAVH